MDELRLRLLGGLVVEGLAAKDVGSRKARTLLAVLAVAPGRPVSVDALAHALWSDELPAKPADQIGVLISRLRGVLGAPRLPRGDAGYALRADWVDVEELGRRVEDARAHLAGGDALSARLVASMALDLSRGPLLPEEDGEWVERSRAAASRLVATAGLVAAEAALASRDPLGAAAAAATTLDLDPYDEAALRLLMEAHVAAGRPASALSAYAEARERLADDLGVSPDADTEALHARILGTEPVPPSPTAVDRYDPLVQRARVELASNDLAAARRDAEEAVRRGGGPGALEMAGWMAYYTRDFPAALRWADEAAARTGEEERRASALTLAGRVRHSQGDLAESEAALTEAVRCPSPGVRAMGEVWLGSLRLHQGHLDEAYRLAAGGGIDAATLRHPFVINHSFYGRVYARAAQGRVADALDDLEAWEQVIADLGQGGVRYAPAAANFRGWILGAIGRRAEAAAITEAGLDETIGFQEPYNQGLLDLARHAIEDGDAAAARRWLDRVEVPPDHAGTMAWKQRQRLMILTARLDLLEGHPEVAAAAVEPALADAIARGTRRAEVQARAVLVEARARAGAPPATAEVARLLEDVATVAGLERWRVAASLAAALDDPALWDDARSAADQLVETCRPPDAEIAAPWLTEELARLRARG